MNLRALISLVATVACFTPGTHAQPITNPLLVGNQTSFNALDLYDGNTGAYRGPFAGPGTGPPGIYFFTFGPNGNLYRSNNTATSAVFQYNGITGTFVNTFVADSGGAFAFGPTGQFYRVNTVGTGILRYDGVTGAPLGTFLPSGLTVPTMIRFGPGGDLFVADGNTITRVNGITGALIGPFVSPGAGGLSAASDFLFTSDGRLLVSGTNSNGNDRVLSFDASTGALIGVFAQGSGLNVPVGMTLGPDSDLYVASTAGNSIKRFALQTGAYLGDIVGLTAHPGPTLIAFAPTAIPEPTSLVFVGATLYFGIRANCRNRQQTLAGSSIERLNKC